jgi:hypothetical protein
LRVHSQILDLWDDERRENGREKTSLECMMSIFWLTREKTNTNEYEDASHVTFQGLYPGFIVNLSFLSVQVP